MTTSETSPPARQVLLVTASVGAGHNQVARALAAGLAEAGWDAQVRIVQVLSHTPGVFRASYVGAYVLGMTKLPAAYGACFKLTDGPRCPARGLSERLRLALERSALRRFEQLVRRAQPELVICTHFLPVPLLGRMKLQGLLASELWVVVTDNYVHRWWYAEAVDRWFVPVSSNVAQLARWGIDQHRICVSGIPVHPKWIAPLDRAGILADWRLPTDMPTVLLSGGAAFTCGPIVRIAESTLDACAKVCLVVLTGHNKHLVAALSRVRHFGTRLFAVPFTDRLHELVEVCSLMVTKPGGVTTAECLAKGTPMVLIDPVPGQEAHNADYLASQGAAVICRGVDAIVERVVSLIEDPVALASLSRSARRLYRPATQTIAEQVRRYLGT